LKLSGFPVDFSIDILLGMTFYFELCPWVEGDSYYRITLGWHWKILGYAVVAPG
jgi:hypothetical protein